MHAYRQIARTAVIGLSKHTSTVYKPLIINGLQPRFFNHLNTGYHILYLPRKTYKKPAFGTKNNRSYRKFQPVFSPQHNSAENVARERA